MDNRESLKTITEHIFGTWRSQDKWTDPLFIQDADGVYFYDEKGKPYLDFSSQLMCSNLGHGNERIIEAVRDQAAKLAYVSPGFACEIKAEAARALGEVMPQGLTKFFFSTSGTEANEAAVKMLRQYMDPNYKIISRYHSYHGSTASSISLTGDPRRWYAERIQGTIDGIVFAPDCYCYRCPFDLDYPGCGIQCAEYLDYIIEEEGNVAAVLVEPIVGTNGKIVPVDEYLPRLREICDDHELLLVADEVMSGWFRTGEWFAVDNWNVRPDILTTAKGATGAYTPLGITATTDKIAQFFEEETLCHGHTYAMHPLALSAIPPAIKEYRRLAESGLIERVSTHIAEEMAQLAKRHRCVGEVRGRGHFWGIEIVKDPSTKEPFNRKRDKFHRELMTDRIAAKALENGLYIHNWYDNLTVSPPLIITEEEFDKGIKTLDEALEIGDEQCC